MQSNEQLLQKASSLISTNVGGIVEPQDAQQFIDLAIDQTPILSELSQRTGIQRAQNIDMIDIGQPVIRSRVEGTDTAAEDISGVNINRKQLAPNSISAYFDVTFAWLRRNILGDLNKENWGQAMQKLNNLFGKRIGKDVVMAVFNGDVDLTPATAGSPTAAEKALMIFDGFIKQALADANVHDYTIPASPVYAGKGNVFSSMLKMLPKDYRDQRDLLAYFVSVDVLDDYEDEIADRQTAKADAVMFGGEKVSGYKRVAVLPVYGLPTDTIILTLKKNLFVGWGVEMETFNQVKPRKDGGKIEVTINLSVDSKSAVGDAIVLGQTA